MELRKIEMFVVQDYMESLSKKLAADDNIIEIWNLEQSAAVRQATIGLLIAAAGIDKILGRA